MTRIANLEEVKECKNLGGSKMDYDLGPVRLARQGGEARQSGFIDKVVQVGLIRAFHNHKSRAGIIGSPDICGRHYPTVRKSDILAVFEPTEKRAGWNT